MVRGYIFVVFQVTPHTKCFIVTQSLLLLYCRVKLTGVIIKLMAGLMGRGRGEEGKYLLDFLEQKFKYKPAKIFYFADGAASQYKNITTT